MTSADRVNASIRKFANWSHPWLFHKSVCSSLGEPDRQLFDDVWQEATDAAHWRQVDLTACSQCAAAALGQAFPLLEAAAITSVVRAAAYEWK